MPSGGGVFEQAYNAQASVELDSMFIVGLPTLRIIRISRELKLDPRRISQHAFSGCTPRSLNDRHA